MAVRAVAFAAKVVRWSGAPLNQSQIAATETAPMALPHHGVEPSPVH